MIKASNIEQNLTCADLRYSPRLTIRYWCPAEWISNHILTDIPQIPSVICWSTEKYHLQERLSVKICVSNTTRFSTTVKHSNQQFNKWKFVSRTLQDFRIVKQKVQQWNSTFLQLFNIIKLRQTSTTFCKYPWKSKQTQKYSNFVELKEVLPNYHSNF